MYIVEKLKLNKFQHVRIPSKKEYFARVGQVEIGENHYSGDEKADFGSNKTEELEKALKSAKSEYEGYLRDKEKANKKEE